MSSNLSNPSPEPIDWDARYAALDTPWDMDQPSPPLVAFEREGVLPQGKRVLVPGCGYGQEVVYLAAQGYTVIGADIAPRAVAKARERLQNYPAASVLCLDLLDAVGTRAVTPVDWVFDQTFFCALPPERRTDWAQAMQRLIRPGGELWVLAFQTDNHDRPPYNSPPEVVLSVAVEAGFTPLGVRVLQAESHPARRGRETLVRMRRA